MSKKRTQNRIRLQEKCRKFLLTKGIDVSSMHEVIRNVENLAGLKLGTGQSSSNAYRRLQRALKVLSEQPSNSSVNRVVVKNEFVSLAAKARQFYDSFEWRKLRYIVLKKYGRICMACGSKEGPMHVDHIKPLKKNWSLRLDITNLQILCEQCNHGKGNWDETDWRPVVKTKRVLLD